MADAARLADAAADLLAQGVTLHVSGCVKACAHPAAADLTLVGRDGRYDVVPGGTTRDKPVATLDLSARVKIGALGEISVNALNIFNAKPEMTAVASPSDTPFDSTNYSAVGRFLGITISRDW